MPSLSELQRLERDLRNGLAALKTLHDSLKGGVDRHDRDLESLKSTVHALHISVTRVATTVEVKERSDSTGGFKLPTPTSDHSAVERWKVFGVVAGVIGSGFIGVINLLLHLIQSGTFK